MSEVTSAAASPSTASGNPAGELFRAIAECSQDAIVATAPDGTVIWWNSAAEQLYGYPGREAIGRSIAKLIFPEQSVARERKMRFSVLGGEPADHYEAEHRRRDGSLVSVGLSLSPLHDPGGRLIGVSMVAHDIGERKRRERQLVRQVARHAHLQRIQWALAEQRLLLYGQPLVDLRSGLATRHEVLLRLPPDQGDGDVVAAAEFLPVAEEFGLIRELDRWVLENVFPLLRDRRLHVNLCGQSIADPETAVTIERGLRAHGCDPSWLTIEASEKLVHEDPDAMREFAARMERLGCGLALDDLAEPSSAAMRLEQLPARYVKIDRSLVAQLPKGRSDQQQVRSIVQTARAFGAKTIADGLETQASLSLLKRTGVDYAQGFLLGHPAPLATLN